MKAHQQITKAADALAKAINATNRNAGRSDPATVRAVISSIQLVNDSADAMLRGVSLGALKARRQPKAPEIEPDHDDASTDADDQQD